MIRLEVQAYCSDCCDFDADVTKPRKEQHDWDNRVVQTDTIIHCKHANRCGNIRRYLERQLKEKKE